jgi:hypothetical protein
MNHEFFLLQSPKAERELSDDEMFEKIFSSKIDRMENMDEINQNDLYFLKRESSKNIEKENIKKESNESEGMNTVLLIDDYDAIFNQLDGNQNMNETEQKINTKNENVEDCLYIEKEDYNIPCFLKNIVSENKYFCPMENEKSEVIIQVDEPKYSKPKKVEIFPKIKRNKKNEKKDKDDTKKTNTKTETKTKTKRGPYKKKQRMPEQVNTDDICFPFTIGKGLLSFPSLNTQMNYSSNNSINYSFINENEIMSEQMDTESKNKKLEEILIDENEQNIEEDVFLLKFTTRKYFIDSNGKKKRMKKKRKYKPDDIRKKIKARFHKLIKNIINENLKKAGSTELFDFIPQCFIGNVSKKLNNEALNLTYKELLSIDYINQINISEMSNNKVDHIKYLRNKEVLNYLEKHPDICKRSGFDIIKNMKYKDLLKYYFNSSQFENSINQLKAENETIDYIQEYIYRAKTYLKFYNSYGDEK